MSSLVLSSKSTSTPNLMLKTLVALLLAWLAILECSTSALAANPQRDTQKREAEAEHAQLRQKLNQLKQDILTTENAKQAAEDGLADSETAISTANRKLFDLQNEQQSTKQKLSDLSAQQEQLSQQIEQQKKAFSTLLRQQYQTGNADRIKLLLSGDDPNRINRELRYLGYISENQNKLITDLRFNLDTVEQIKTATLQAKTDLDDIANEQSIEKTNLEAEKSKRATLLNSLASKLADQRKQAGQIQKNEQRMANLIGQLTLLIEKQRQADIIAQEKARREKLAQEEKARQLAAENAAAAAIAAKNAKNAKNAKKNTVTTSKITKAPEIKLAPTPSPPPSPPPTALALAYTPPDDHSAFSQMRGHLRIPVKGEISAKFGSPRGEGNSWKGIFIRAPEGSEIRAIAPGKIVFSEWLRGFGNLIIIDHGNQYMTIYGNNQSILKQAGDNVKAGEQIASAGNSGGNEQSGLYFEMRHQGRAFDPLSWISIK